MNKIREKILLWYEKMKAEVISYKCMLLPVGIMSGLYLLGITAILRANFNYIDDMRRVVHGIKEWDVSSRFVSYYLSTFIHFGNHLTDISPLPQLIAVVILAVSSVIILYVMTGKTKFNLWEYAAVIPLGLSPYFLECISYKYDSPYMALSILGGVLPLFFLKYGYLVYFLMSFAGILIVCNTYQAATGIFPLFVMFMALKRWNEKESEKEIGKFVGTSILGYVTGLLFYRSFIMVPINSYISSDVPALNRLFPIAWKHLQRYSSYIDSDFRVEWKILIVFICIAFIYVSIRDSKRKKYAAIPVTLLIFVGAALLMFGIYPMLESPLFDPRTMYGLGAFIAFMGVYVASAKKMIPGKLVCLALSYAFVVFAFTYGNALYVQKTYTDFRITETIDDLLEIESFNSEETKNVQIIGSIGHAPALRSLPQDYQMLNRLVPITFSNSSWGWGRFGFEYYYSLKNIVFDDTVDLRNSELPILVENQYHVIYGDKKNILIKLFP